MKKQSLIVMLMCVLCLSSYAQDNPPSTLTADDVFTDAVIVIGELPQPTALPANCGFESTQYFSNPSDWYIIPHDTYAAFELCNRQTDERIGITINTEDCRSGNYPTESPDGRWVLYMSCFNEGTFSTFVSASLREIAVYDTVNQTSHNLGRTDFISNRNWYWIDNDTALLISRIDTLVYSSELTNHVYLLELGDTLNMRHLLERPTNNFRYVADPPRIVWLETESGQTSLHQYDIVTEQATVLTNFTCQIPGARCFIYQYSEDGIVIWGSDVSGISATQLLILDSTTYLPLFETRTRNACLVDDTLIYGDHTFVRVGDSGPEILTIHNLSTGDEQQLVPVTSFYCGDVSSNERFILVHEHAPEARQSDTQIYDLYTQTTIRFLNPLPNQWWVRYQWYNDDSLIVNASHDGGTQYSWLVQIEESSQ